MSDDKKGPPPPYGCTPFPPHLHPDHHHYHHHYSPHHHHHPSPSHHHTTTYTYVPAPVVIPAYPGHLTTPAPGYAQPSYINNYYYHQPAETVRVVESASPAEQIEWIPCAGGAEATKYSQRAVIAGKYVNIFAGPGSPLWVIRAHHCGDLIPGKLFAKQHSASVPYAGKEITVHNFELLCAPSHGLQWLPALHGQIPVGAIPAGNTIHGESLYIGRGSYFISLIPGKVHPSHGCLYISHAGKEVAIENYEVLCTKSLYMK